MVDVIIAIVLGIVIGAFGVVIWALNAVQKKNRGITVMEDKSITDQDAIEAINTIRWYCDGKFCHDCAIEKICKEYFDNSIGDPEDWPEVEVPDES